MLWSLISLGLPIAAFYLVLLNRKRIEESDLRDRRRIEDIVRLEQRLAALEKTIHGTEPVPSAPARPAKSAAPPPPAPVVTPARAAPTAEPPRPPSFHVTPPHPRPEVSFPGASSTPPRLPPFPAPQKSSESVPRPPRRPAIRFTFPDIDWEGLVGVKLFSWIAGIALVFGAVFFLRYSIEQGWLGPPIRMVVGLLLGTGLLVLCELRLTERYPVTANALEGAGIAILFSTLFASHTLWHLLPQLPVFVCMSLVTAIAVLLSIRRNSVFIALLGLVGGFATPALLSGGADRPIGLFSYLLLLNGGLAWVAFRQGWPWLTALSVVLTALYQWAWVLRFLDASRLPLAMSIFAVFPVLHVAAAVLARRRAQAANGDARLAQPAALAAALPILFAFYSAAAPAYGVQYALLFAFLFFVAAGLTAVAASGEPPILYQLGGMSSIVVFVLWFATSYAETAWPGILGFITLFVLFYLGVQLVQSRFGPAFRAETEASIMAPALLFTFPVLALVEPETAAPGLLFGVLFALIVANAAVAVPTENGRAHFLSALFALAAQAVWSAKHLTPDRLLSALTLYAGFALLYLVVPLAADRAGKKLRPEGSGALVLFVSLGLLFFLTTASVAHAALWGLSLLLVLVNAGLLLEASRSRFPVLALAGMVLSWIVLGVWCLRAMAFVWLLPLLLVVGSFALVITGGTLWAEVRARNAGISVPVLRNGLYLALAAHVFLLFIASQRTLAIPPWPWFAVMGVLDLAIGAAALYTRRGDLHAAALLASQVVLLAFLRVAEGAPWPLVAMVAADAVAALGIVWMPLARRRGAPGWSFSGAAAIGIVLAQCITIAAAELAGSAGLAILLPNHLLLLVAFLAVAWVMDGQKLALLAIVMTSFAVERWLYLHLNAGAWLDGVLFAGAIYAVFLAYPIALGSQGKRSRDPYLTAVVASVMFFFQARRCINTGGGADFIGALPVAQALLLLGLLLHLLRLEPAGQRDPGRLAIIAGAALGFVTLAIPLQLDREWITIAWALEGAALAWLYGRIPHRGLLAWSAALCVVVFVRLCFNPAVFAYHTRGGLPIWNWYLYTYLVTVAALFAAARLLRRTDDRIVTQFRVSDWLPAGATVLLFLLLNIEIADFYATGRTLTFNFSAGLAQDLTYTLGWALFAIGLLTAGIVRGIRLARIAALALLVVTIVKCFLHDVWRLGELYRVGSFVGLAVCLAAVAVLLQRFVLGGQKETA